MGKPIVGSMSEWSGILKDVFRQIDDGSLTLEQFRAFAEHRNPFVVPSLSWHEVYKALGMEAEYAEFRRTNPGQTENPDFWTVPAINGVTPNRVVSAMRKLGVVFALYQEDMDNAVSTNDRDPSKGSYVVGFRRTVEADPENANESANDLAKAGHKGITLLERLLLELGYFLATNKHLDEQNVTLCAGSRDSDGSVPRVCWSADRRGVYVRWCGPDDSGGHLHSRSVVSLPPQSREA